MKIGYVSELHARKKNIDAAKSKLEGWYAKRLDETAVVGGEKASFDKLMAAADNAILAANGTLASIRKAIVT